MFFIYPKKCYNIYMKLTDNEKRDIIKYLENNKPLPEKYRFLLFEDAKEVELLWNEKTNEVTNTILPFQTIEYIDEPRSEDKINMQGSLFDLSGRQIKGWINKLIWGDNKLILSSLKNGPLRKQIEAEGGLKLIYIDPPFDVGADFSMNIEIGEESFTKTPSVIEEIAYRDTWGKGADSFIAMIYERLKLMHGLLVEDSSIYVHCDWRVNSYMRLVLDEIFGKQCFRNQIVWKRTNSPKSQTKNFGYQYDSLLYYSKHPQKFTYNQIFTSYSKKQLIPYSYEDENGKFRLIEIESKGSQGYKPAWIGEWRGRNAKWLLSKNTLEELYSNNKMYQTKNGRYSKKQYLSDMKGVVVSDLWIDGEISPIQGTESIGYPTQKPEKLLERIIKTSSNDGDLVADFFCGSGTTLAVAERLGRKWIGTDLGKFSIHTTRKRMIGVQRELKKERKNFRAFEILNIGKYERESFIRVNENLREEEKRKQQEKKERNFVDLILSAYKAQAVDSFNNFVGKKRDRLIAVGPVNNPVTREFIDEVIKESKEKGITKFDVLGFDYEMGLDFSALSKQGVDVQFKIIPTEVFDRKAIEKDQVRFYDVAYIEVKPVIKGKGNKNELAVELVDFSVFYNQDSTGKTEEKLKSGGSKIVIENGQIIKVWKDKETDIIEREILTKKWSDWIDYWAVDFDFESKKEIIKVIGESTNKEKEVWTGNYIFENEWQSFRTKKNRNLELTSSLKEVPKGKLKVAVKVVDIFGNDTTKIIEVNI